MASRELWKIWKRSETDLQLYFYEPEASRGTLVGYYTRLVAAKKEASLRQDGKIKWTKLTKYTYLGEPI